MSEVNTAVFRSDLRQFDDLICRCKPVGHILERGTQAECTLLHRRSDELFHLFQFGGCSRPVVFADDVIAHASCANKCCDVNGRPRLRLEPSEIVGQRTPILRDAKVFGGGFCLSHHPIIDRGD